MVWLFLFQIDDPHNFGDFIAISFHCFVFSNYVPRVEINVQVIEDEEEEADDVDEAEGEEENDVDRH